ncbi:alginate lyase family protein [Acetobacter sp.]|jgi:hypothetical protein|uniref:alginate lyase family protein n=1 Tax=Acetobacter sp. TaxID=440 RepID=UPI0025BBA2AE|nr:alginate lyase family protein [Acetobacter sp.]MCH4089640.1 alginate lyase family protein [Acetobacter sp.]MCI1300620.1 alginate lyase family protein [Acetobacter sp.]MCI1317014.1 alginate lyase family protein [Acetobacter sp.]
MAAYGRFDFLWRVLPLTFSAFGLLAPQTICAAERNWCEVLSIQGRSSLPLIASTLRERQNQPPSPLPRVHTEGTLPHQGIYDESIAAKKDLPVMLDAALAWHITADVAWLAMAQQYLLAWVETYQPSYNPIDETGFDALIDTYAIIRDTFSSTERARITQFLERWAQGYLRSIDEQNQSKIWINNWQSHRVKLLTLIATALDDHTLFEAARTLFQKQLTVNIAKTGETEDFEDRDALHYVVYDLQPLVQAALAAQRRGEDWYHWTTPDGASLEKAVAWLTPYVSGQKNHEEFVNTHVRFDLIRLHAGEKGFSGLFDPHVAAPLYWFASLLDPTLGPLAKGLSNTPPPFVALCGL